MADTASSCGTTATRRKHSCTSCRTSGGGSQAFPDRRRCSCAWWPRHRAVGMPPPRIADELAVTGVAVSFPTLHRPEQHVTTKPQLVVECRKVDPLLQVFSFDERNGAAIRPAAGCQPLARERTLCAGHRPRPQEHPRLCP